MLKTIGISAAILAVSTSCVSLAVHHKGVTHRKIALASGIPKLGINGDLNGKQVFPPDNPWNLPVDKARLDPNSSTYLNTIGLNTKLHPDYGAQWDGGPFGIPYIVISNDVPKVKVSFDYADESDPGPYPIPDNAPIEKGDKHVIILDRDNWKLYELFDANHTSSGWHAGSGAIFDMNSNKLRPAGWTSADAAGLPIFPGLVRYDEVVNRGVINHALRFTVQHTRQSYIPPARHFASHSDNQEYPPMGLRMRLKASYNISGYPAHAQVVLRALKKYGMILADNGSNLFLSGAADARWNDDEMNTLKKVHASDFEVVTAQ